MLTIEQIGEKVRIAENNSSRKNKLQIFLNTDTYNRIYKDSIYTQIDVMRMDATLFGWDCRECSMIESILIVEVLPTEKMDIEKD